MEKAQSSFAPPNVSAKRFWENIMPVVIREESISNSLLAYRMTSD
jgi:hypothetical protein